MSRLLVVFNVCGIRGLERLDKYVDNIEGLLAQNHKDFKVAVSGCLSTRQCQAVLNNRFKGRVALNWIHERWPVNVTFNHTVMKCLETYGVFDGVVYVDSGIAVQERTTQAPDGPELIAERKTLLSRMDAKMLQGFAMVAAHVDEDNGFDWCRIAMQDQDYVLPMGQSCNLHIQLFSKALVDAFDGKLLPDIFTGDTSESVFPFMCGVVGGGFCILRKPVIHHTHSMDGAHCGFRGRQWPFVLFPDVTDMRYICDVGHPYGFGYEECQKFCVHDPAKYTDGKANDDRLLPFMKQYLYLPTSKLDYAKIKHEWRA